MVSAASKEEFDGALQNIRGVIPSSNIDLRKYTDTVLDSQRDSFARYIIETYYGNRFRVGSNPSESNHSSILNFLFQGGSDSLKRTKHSCHRYVKLLLNRDHDMIKKMNSHLAELNCIRVNKQYEIENMKSNNHISDNDKTMILLPAVKFLSVKSFEIFFNQFKRYKSYSVAKCNDGSFTVTYSDGNSYSKEYKFESGQSRCRCRDRISEMIQCRHELSIHKQFLVEYFDVSHAFRSEVTYSRERVVDTGVESHQNNVLDIRDEENSTMELFHRKIDTATNPVSTSTVIGIKQLPNVKHTYATLQPIFNEVLRVLVHHDQKLIKGIAALMIELQKPLIRKLCNNDESVLLSTIEECVLLFSNLKLSATKETIVRTQGSSAINRIRSNGEKARSAAAAAVVASIRPDTETQTQLKHATLSQRSCSFCGSPHHTSPRCNVRLSLGKNVNYQELTLLILSDSAYSVLNPKEIVHELPQDVYYICVLGVYTKTIPTTHMFGLDHVVLHVRSLSKYGMELSVNFHEALTIFAFLNKVPGRDIFFDSSSNIGPGWYSRG